MGKKSNKSLRDTGCRETYTDSEYILDLRKRLLEDKEKENKHKNNHRNSKRKSKNGL